MHVPGMILMTIFGHVLSTVKRAFDFYDFMRRRFGRVAVAKAKLQRIGVEAAWQSPTASTMRGSRIRLRTTTDWRVALELQYEGCGYVRDGCYEVWVNAMPPVIRGL
jgi:hypothetical protein